MTIHYKLFVVLSCVLFCSVGAYSFAEHREEAIKKDIDHLYKGNNTEREEAVKRLVAAAAPAIPPLVAVVCNKTKPHFDEAWPFAAKALAQLKAQAATSCLTQVLTYKLPPIGQVIMKSDETLARLDPAFAALVQIGEPAVPTIRKYLPTLQPEAAIMALRVLRAINTASAKEAAEAYVGALKDQIRLADMVIQDFGKKW